MMKDVGASRAWREQSERQEQWGTTGREMPLSETDPLPIGGWKTGNPDHSSISAKVQTDPPSGTFFSSPAAWFL